MSNNKKLTVINGETLMNMRIKSISFCIDSLLPQSVSLLCGAPNIGKSWLVLDWCVRIAKGEEVWNFKTTKVTEESFRTDSERNQFGANADDENFRTGWEEFLNNTLQKGQELESAIAAQVKRSTLLTTLKWIAITVLSSAVSTLLLNHFLG